MPRSKTIKKILLLLICTLVLIITNLGLYNSVAICNILKNHSEKKYLPSQLQLINWNQTETEGLFVSNNDPIIELPNVDTYVSNVTVHADVPKNKEYNVQVFWKDEEIQDYSEENSLFGYIDPNMDRLQLTIRRPVTSLRIDLFEEEGVKVHIEQITVNERTILYPFWAFLVPGIVAFILWHFLFVDPLIPILLKEKDIIAHMARNDLHARYAGSALGVFWAFAQPIMTMAVLWFVFQVGFRQKPVDNVPFILWFAAGYIPWMFYSDTIMASTGSLNEYSYLVKKIRFQIEILPAIKIISAAIVHMAFIVFLVALFLIYHYPVNVFWFQIIYYIICMVIHLLGLSFVCASLAVFMKDLGQVIALTLQLLFWISPVVWAPENMNQTFLPVLKLNPVYYIIQGYRNSVLYSVPFWNDSVMMIRFWLITAVFLIVGSKLFQRLKPHFPDLL